MKSQLARRGALSPLCAALARLILLSLLLPIISPVLYSQQALRPEATVPIVERGPHYRAGTISDPLRPGRTRRVEYWHTGMNYLSTNGWETAVPEFEPAIDGFSATRIQNRTWVSSDIYLQGAVRIASPTGQIISATPVALLLFDRQSGRHVTVATLTNSPATLVSSNQIRFANAFLGACADVWVTVTEAYTESDLVLTGQIDPADYLCNPDTTELQIVTELFSTPTPDIDRSALWIESNPQIRSTWAAPDLTDDRLTWGDLFVGSGWAFLNSSPGLPEGLAVPVLKSYVATTNNVFLIERVAFSSIAEGVRTLPDCQPPGGDGHGRVFESLPAQLAALPRALPAKPRELAMSQTKPAFVSRRGLTIDYRASLGGGSVILAADVTYLAGVVTCSSLTAEGGTCVKLKTNGCITVTGTFATKGSKMRPIVFCPIDDDSYGETMNGFDSSYTGTINTNGYGNPMLALATGMNFSHCRFSYAQTAIGNYGFPSSFTLTANHSQFLNCNRAISISSSGSAPATTSLTLNNTLVANGSIPFYVDTYVASLAYSASHCTFDHASQLWSSRPPIFNAYNSIFANITNTSPATNNTWNGSNNGFFNASSFGSSSLIASNSPFQTVGGGSYYLTDASGFRNAGTGSGPPAAILTDIKQRTTYPPVLVTGITLTNDQSLFPQAQRDTDAPDLGWHPDSLDYLFSGVLATNCAVTMSNGVVLGAFGSSTNAFGLAIGRNASLTSMGAPNNPNWFVQANIVQEAVVSGAFQPTNGLLISEFQGLSPCTINCRFTQFSVPAQASPHFNAPTNTGPLNFRDCEFHGGQLLSAGPTLNLTNCLLERVSTDVKPRDALTTGMRNCLVYYGVFRFGPTNSTIAGNFFHGCAISNWIGGWGNIYSGSNMFLTGADRLYPTNSGDKIASGFALRAGPLGPYYIFSGNLANFGPGTADTLGLYHYTITTNIVNGYQIPETNSVVDCLYHYVATDSSGNPIDSDGDGIPDYVEDINGDGSAAGDLTSWLNSENGTTGSAGLQVFTPLK